MKKIFLFLLTSLISVSSFAQNLPQGIAYQAVAVKESPYSVAGENPQAIYWSNKDIKVRFTILDQYPNPMETYQEFHSVSTDDYGVFNLIIGQGTVISGDFETIPWELGAAHLQVEIDFDNDNNYVLTSFERFWSVPYAKHSQSTKEIDPIFNASLANSISPSDTASWNNKLDSYTETDPIFNVSVAKGISSSDTTSWNNKLDSYTETDPVFNSSVAKGISSSDTASWNNKLDSYTETDPVFNSSVAKGISSSDTASWNNKLDSYTETDPVFNSSVAKGISSSDTTSWNNKLDSYTETDPVFNSSVAKGISSSDTASWNQNARNNLDIDSTNEIQTISLVNDTIFLNKNGGKIALNDLKTYINNSTNSARSSPDFYIKTSDTLSCRYDSLLSSGQYGFAQYKRLKRLDTFNLKAGDVLQIQRTINSKQSSSGYYTLGKNDFYLTDNIGNRISGWMVGFAKNGNRYGSSSASAHSTYMGYTDELPLRSQSIVYTMTYKIPSNGTYYFTLNTIFIRQHSNNFTDPKVMNLGPGSIKIN